ncbi:MAG: hypothetical protein R2829_10240 [Bacteroidia bacterium]
MQGIYTIDRWNFIMDNGGPDINYNNNDNSVVTHQHNRIAIHQLTLIILEVYNVFDSILIY